jgi:hypothetical protein
MPGPGLKTLTLKKQGFKNVEIVSEKTVFSKIFS